MEEKTNAIKHERAFNNLPVIDKRRKSVLESERLAAVTKRDYNMAKRLLNKETKLS